MTPPTLRPGVLVEWETRRLVTPPLPPVWVPRTYRGRVVRGTDAAVVVQTEWGELELDPARVRVVAEEG